jgi:O-antigen ligase
VTSSKRLPTASRSTQWLPWAALALVSVMLVPLTMRSTVALALIGAVVIVATARISVAIPLGLSGFAPPIVALVGHDPFPSRSVPLITFGWLALAVAFGFRGRVGAALRGALSSPLVVSTAALFALLLVRLPASTDSSYGSFKLQLFVLGNLAVLVGGILLGTRSDDIELYLILTLAIDALSGVLVLRQFGTVTTGPTDRFGLPQQSVIALGVQGAEALMVSTFMLVKGRRRWQQLFGACVIPVSLVALLASGSRGPVLGGSLGLVVLLVMLARTRRAALRIAVFSAVVVASFALVTQLVPSGAAHRSLSVVTGSRSGLASNGRNQLWQAGWNTFVAHPLLGAGTGSFATEERQTVCPGPGCLDKYPHNVLLETAAELGIGGVVLMTIVLVSAGAIILRVRRLGGRNADFAAILFALFVSAATTAMLTGDITGDGGIWLQGGIALGVALAARSRRQAYEADAAPATTLA